MYALLLALFAFALSAVPAQAQERPTSSWVDAKAIGFYDSSKTEFEVTTPEQLAELASHGDSANPSDAFRGKTIKLMNDIDLSGRLWTPFFGFTGTFDGNGHAIKNMYVADEKGANEAAGFFGSIYAASVHDLVIENATVVFGDADGNTRGFSAGILAANLNAVADSTYETTTEIQNVGVSGTIFANYNVSFWPCALGGIAGQVNGPASIAGCWSGVDIVVNENACDGITVGGLFGSWDDVSRGALLKDASFTGSLEVHSGNAIAGGAIGASTIYDGSFLPISPFVKNCFVKPASIDVTADSAYFHSGSFQKSGEYVPVQNCYWPNDGSSGVALFGEDGAVQAPDDQSVFGEPTDDFASPSLVAKLNVGTAEGAWAEGVDGYPVLVAAQVEKILADYSAIDAAVAKIPASLGGYTKASVSAVDAARDAIEYNIPKTEQDRVDAMAKALENAIAALEKLADYSKVDAQLEKAQKIERERYTAASLGRLDEAVSAVRRGLGVSKQGEVDEMAAGIERAIASLAFSEQEGPTEEPDNPNDTDNPAAPDNPDSEKPGKPEDEGALQDSGQAKGDADDVELPRTGDTSAVVAPLLFSAVVFLGGGSMLKRKHR